MTRGFFRDQAGQSFVELALALPILVFGLLGGADLARAYAVQLAVQNGARAGAEAAAIDFAPDAYLAGSRALDEIARTPGLNSADAIITVKIKGKDGLTNCVDPPTVAAPCFATVRVQYTFKTVTPWPLVPNRAVFDRHTTMRMIVGPPCDSPGTQDDYYRAC
ncbi:MAG TPA: TadE/TadG family type IV pilus assembly protein [Solirubrobacteraceae bacterium]|nr:TadE/TadG family type IV pilus assembly protein [Solirubrobacteraceae bacterium]